MIKKYLIYLISLLAFLIPLYLFYNPPTDRDGGPMLSYNFLFFFPLLIMAIILSIILLVLSLKSFRKNKFKNSILAITTFPALFLLAVTILHVIRISGDDSDFRTPVEVLNRYEKISVNKNLSITLTGYTYEKIRKKITFIPESSSKIRYTTNTFCQGDFSTFFLYYKIKNDSIYIYIPDNETLYYINDGLKVLPIKTIQLRAVKKDSLDLLTKKTILKKFIWK